MKRKIYGGMLALCLSVTALLPVAAPAQSLWLDQSRDPGISLEILKPNFENGDDVTFFSAAYVLSGRFALTRALHLTAEVPFSHFGLDAGVVDESDTGIGNPYLGLEIGARERPFYGELGVRVPLAGDDTFVSGFEDALVSGFASDLDRWEAFFEDVLSFGGQLNYRYQIAASNFSVRLRGGSNLWIYTGDGFEDDADLFANYGAQLWYDADRVHLGGGLTGRAILTADGAFNDRTIHQLGLSALGDFHRIQPGVHFRLPVDNALDNLVDYVFGLSLTVPLP